LELWFIERKKERKQGGRRRKEMGSSGFCQSSGESPFTT
jgi:hypothetical protein